MKLIIGIATLLYVWPAWGQTYNKRFDLRENGRFQTCFDIEQWNESYLLVQGSFELDTLGPNLYATYTTIALTRIANSGEKIWDKRMVIPWHATVPGWANCCDSMPGGGVVVGGSRQDTLQNLAVLLVVFDANGDTVFTRDLGIPGQQWNGFSVKRTQEGGFIIVGQTDATGYLDGFAIKTDALGNEEWRRTYGQSGSITDGMLTIVQLPDGDYIASGSHYPTNETKRWWLQRLDPTGEVEWSEYYTTFPIGGPAAHLDITADGYVLLASSWQYAEGSLELRPYLAKIDPSDGSVVWENEYGPVAEFHILYAVKEAPNGDLFACGVSEEIGGMQGVLLRTTSAGDSLWMRRYFYQDSIISQGVGQFYDVLPTPDGGFIATGPVYSQLNQPNPPGYSQDAWVVKVDGYGCLVPGCQLLDGVEEQATNLLDALSIFPNPAHGRATVQLSLPPSVVTSNLELTLVSADGRVVRRERLIGNGVHTLALDALALGLYHAHVTQGGKWLTGGNLVVE